MDKARHAIDPHVHFYAKMPLVSFLGLMHFRVPFAGGVFVDAGASILVASTMLPLHSISPPSVAFIDGV